MKPKLSRLLTILAVACIVFPSIASGLNIRIRYDNDGGFFPEGSEARVALRAVCDFYEEIITDRLGAIDPRQFAGASWQARYTDPSTGQKRIFRAPNGSSNIIIPENDFFLFAGGRNLPGQVGGEGGGTEFIGATASSDASFYPWVAQVVGRGQPGAGRIPGDELSRTDYAPWGGIVTFDNDRLWDFSLDGRGSTGGNSFVSVALHEVAHALGFGVADSYYNLIQDSKFAGPATRIAYANRSGPRSVPLSSASHFRDDGATSCTEDPGGFGSNGVFNTLSRTVKLFGTPANSIQQVLMDSSTCNGATFHPVMTRVDLAALQDIGWNVIEQIDPESLDLAISFPPSASPTPPVLTFVTQTNFTYQLQRSENLLVWEDVGSPVTGNGNSRSLADSDLVHGGCSYRITISAPAPPQPKAAPKSLKMLPLLPLLSPKGFPRLSSGSARICKDCEFHTHDHDH